VISAAKYSDLSSTYPDKLKISPFQSSKETKFEFSARWNTGLSQKNSTGFLDIGWRVIFG